MPIARPRWSPGTTTPSTECGRASSGMTSATWPGAHQAPDAGRGDRLAVGARDHGRRLHPQRRASGRTGSASPPSPRRRGRSGSSRRPRSPPRSTGAETSISAKRSARMRENALVKGTTSSSSTPSRSISWLLRPIGVRTAGRSSGRRTAIGWGSKVRPSTVRRRSAASSIARRMTAWWPRWTPSKVPIATTRRGPAERAGRRATGSASRAGPPAPPRAAGRRSPGRATATQPAVGCPSSATASSPVGASPAGHRAPVDDVRELALGVRTRAGQVGQAARRGRARPSGPTSSGGTASSTDSAPTAVRRSAVRYAPQPRRSPMSLGQPPDVGAGGAAHRQGHHPAAVVLGQPQAVDLDLALGPARRPRRGGRAGRGARRPTLTAARAGTRWTWRPRKAAARAATRSAAAGSPGRLDRALGVAGRRREAGAQRGEVGLVEGRHERRQARRAAHEHHQQAGRERVERAGVADLRPAARGGGGCARPRRARSARRACRRARGRAAPPPRPQPSAPSRSRRASSSRPIHSSSSSGSRRRAEPGRRPVAAAALLAGDLRDVHGRVGRAQGDAPGAVRARLAHEGRGPDARARRA